MNILMVASEAAPFLRTGDVANVVTSFSLELRKPSRICPQGHDVRLIIPCYRNLVLESEPHTVIEEFDVPLGSYSRKARLLRIDYKRIDHNTEPTSLPVYLIDNQFYF